MTIKIGKKEYEYSISFSVLLKYMAVFGEKYLETFLNEEKDINALSLVRLVWCSLQGAPRFDVFLKIAAKDKKFPQTAQMIQAQMFQSFPEKNNNLEDAPNEALIDELDVLAAIMMAGALELIDKLPVFMIVNAISRKTNILSEASSERGERKMRKMTAKEISELYGGGKA